MEDHRRTVLFLEAKGIDWDAVHDKYSPLIIPTMSNDDLFDILSQMLYILKDGHVNLSSAKRTSFYDEWYQVTTGTTGKIFSIKLIWQCQHRILYIRRFKV